MISSEHLLKCGEIKPKTLELQSSTPVDSICVDPKYLGKFLFCLYWTSLSRLFLDINLSVIQKKNCLPSIYTVLGVLSYPKMINTVQEGVLWFWQIFVILLRDLENEYFGIHSRRASLTLDIKECMQMNGCISQAGTLLHLSNTHRKHGPWFHVYEASQQEGVIYSGVLTWGARALLGWMLMEADRGNCYWWPCWG